jgi:hypothetical protein
MVTRTHPEGTPSRVVPEGTLRGHNGGLRSRKGTFQGRYSTIPDTLRGVYERYCESEAMALLSLMPREALRGFYRRAAEWAERTGEEGREDPLALVRRFARALLPLPPYERWVPDYLANRSAYLEALDIPTLPRRTEPVAVAVRAIGNGWHAALCLTGAPDGWKGFLQFHRSEGVQSVRTTDVFRGEDPEEFRSRFEAFDPETLRAFLRSALP